MSKSKITNLKKLESTKFMGLYDIEYTNKNNEQKHWTVASRKNEEILKNIYLKNKEDKVDAVVVAALHVKEEKLVLIKQFRVPINKYIYELPAGLIDNDDSIEDTVKRELKEETGLDVISINSINANDKLYLSPGMTDESVALVYCLCDGKISNKYLESDEEIEAILVSKEEAQNLLEEGEALDIKMYLMLQMFIKLGNKMFE